MGILRSARDQGGHWRYIFQLSLKDEYAERREGILGKGDSDGKGDSEKKKCRACMGSS